MAKGSARRAPGKGSLFKHISVQRQKPVYRVKIAVVFFGFYKLIPHTHIFYQVKGDMIDVKVGWEPKTFKADKVMQINPPKMEKFDDVSNMTYLNEAAVLWNLKARYVAKLIYVSIFNSYSISQSFCDGYIVFHFY